MQTEVTTPESTITTDPVAAAQARVDEKRKAEADAKAALEAAIETLRYAEQALFDERSRLSEHDALVTRAVLERKPIPSAAPSSVEAINDAIVEAKSNRSEAERELKAAIWSLGEAERELVAAQEAQTLNRIAELLRTQKELIQLASTLRPGAHSAAGVQVERKHKVIGHADVLGHWQPAQANSVIFTIELEAQATN